MSLSSIQYRSLDFLGFPGYKVGDDGSVWSLKRSGRKKTSYEMEVLIHDLYAQGMIKTTIARKIKMPYSRVISVLKRDPQPEKWKKLSCKFYDRKHYPMSTLCREDGERLIIAVHQLVLLAFVGPCPPGLEARHFPDRSKANNRLDNLQWGTPEQNCLDKIYHGTDNSGEKNSMSKLTNKNAKKIRRLYKTGQYTMRKIADTFSVSVQTVCNVIHRKCFTRI